MENEKKCGEQRSYLRSPDGKHFDSRRKAMVHMKTNHYESQFLSGMLRASLVKIGDKVQFCQGSCLGQVPADNI